jgi:hypothetical protein
MKKAFSNRNSEISKNRHGKEQIFTPDGEGNVIWNADFDWFRYSLDDDGNIIMVDPSGGPYLAKGMNSNLVHPDIQGKKIDYFVKVGSGYKIIFE